MIKFEQIEVWGIKHAIRGMRNPLNSWERSDTVFDGDKMCLGENDIDLMTRLIRGGAPHRKFLRQISYRWILPLLSTGGRSSIHTRSARQLIAVPPCTRYRQRSSP